MTEERSHQFIHEAELAERYVAGRMPAAERVAFEDHFVACEVCQRDLRFAGALRAALAGSAGAARGAAASSATHDLALVPAGRTARTRQRGAWWAGAAIAAGIAAVMLVRAVPSRAITGLGAVDAAPAYLGIAVRSSSNRGDAAFEAAMKNYAAGDYAAAANGLHAALAAGEDSIPTEFFIGASFLFSGNPTDAAPAFARVVAKGDSPYRDEAQWYRAKALLRLGRGADAMAALTAHASADPVMAARFAALADSVTLAGGR